MTSRFSALSNRWLAQHAGAARDSPGRMERSIFVSASERTCLTPTSLRLPHGLCGKLLHSASQLEHATTGVSKFIQQCVDINASRRAEALKSYSLFREETNRVLDPVLKNNKLVLFLDGSVDAPRCRLSHNVVKMLAQVQAVPLISVDIGAHAAIEGYALEKTGNPSKVSCPLLFKQGAVLGGHDELLRLFPAQLQSSIGCEGTRSSNKYYKGELPIALY